MKCAFGNLLVKRDSDSMLADFGCFYIGSMAALLTDRFITHGIEETCEMAATNLRKLWHQPV